MFTIEENRVSEGRVKRFRMQEGQLGHVVQLNDALPIPVVLVVVVAG